MFEFNRSGYHMFELKSMWNCGSYLYLYIMTIIEEVALLVHMGICNYFRINTAFSMLLNGAVLLWQPPLLIFFWDSWQKAL